MSLLIISPHLDDAVLSVGEIIAAHEDVTVATVFAGMHPSPTLLTAYDKATGFGSSQEAMNTRRTEDDRAMSVLNAKAERAPFLDGQYGIEQSRKEIFDWIRDLSEIPDQILLPLGLKHPDHIVVGAEARAATKWHNSVWMYEELPYRVQFPENVAAEMRTMRRDGWEMELGSPWPTPPTSMLHLKVAAMECYRSQVSPEMVRWSQVPERIWSLKHD